MSRFGVAVSGGPDSVALLLLAAAAFPDRVQAATVDHGLRAESAEEAIAVADLCQRLGVPHAILNVTLEPGNVQSAARTARYEALEAWMAADATKYDHLALATAHHADDQAETLLMRLNRSSGLAGLAGIRPARTLFPDPNISIALVRPLLRWRKSELEQIVCEAGLVAAIDPSNFDEWFDRARVRAALQDADWIDPVALSESAIHLADAHRLIEILAFRERGSECKRVTGGFDYTPVGFALIGIEVLKGIYADLGVEVSRAECARAYERLNTGSNASLGGILATVHEFFDEEDCQMAVRWEFRPEPPRKG